MHERVLPRAVGMFLVFVAVFAFLPRPAVADPARSSAAEMYAKKAPKKIKRKGGGDAEARSRDDAAYAPMPRAGRAFAPLPPAADVEPAEIAVATAHAQIGKPYRYGATGPSGFDCSGLTSFAWAAAGVRLPRTSRSQFSSLRRVPLDEIEPGDIVYRPGHVGLYIGKGRMIHAPQTGRRVEIAPLNRAVGAVRPSGD